MAYTINCNVFQPFGWLSGDPYKDGNANAWAMLCDYADEDEYEVQDAILRYLNDNPDYRKELPEELQRRSPMALMEYYKQNAPITIANALKKIADAIIDGDLVINFQFN